ncbi:Precursor of CEP16 [Hirschfeldia incana]|nr:Precursor of CEP16 [Hirschfeldia incana]
MAKNRTEHYVVLVSVLIIMVGSVLLATEGRPVKYGSTALTQTSKLKPVESSVQDVSSLATMKQSGPSPGVGHHRAKGYKTFGRVRDNSGPSPGVGH